MPVITRLLRNEVYESGWLFSLIGVRLAQSRGSAVRLPLLAGWLRLGQFKFARDLIHFTGYR